MSARQTPYQSTVFSHLAAASSVWYHTCTLWLFVVSDIKSIVLPSTIFAFAQACVEDEISMHEFAVRFPKTIAWIMVNLLAFSINNQRSPSAIIEDRWNKPWRPLPSGRLTVGTARRLGWSASVLALVAGSVLGGGTVQGILIVTLSYFYNDGGMGDRHGLARNLLNAGGMSAFAAGALSVTQQSSMSREAIVHLAVVATVIGTTIHSQDMYDQAGDEKIGRQTIPLVIGDRAARMTIGVAVMLWSVVVPMIQDGAPLGSLPVLGLGVIVAGRTLAMTSVADDVTTFSFYNVWLMAIYVLPLTASGPG